MAKIQEQALMRYEWDSNKADRNLRKHGIAFEMVRSLDWDSVLESRDTRHNDEARMSAWGLIEKRLYVLIYTMRGSTCRVISLRKANNREMVEYEQAQTPTQH